MTEASFKNGEKCIMSSPLTQWDYGQHLIVRGMNYSEDVKIEVHFACGRGNGALVSDAEYDGGDVSAKIPDELLKTGEEIRAYIFLIDENSGKTVYTVIIPVKRRKKPEDYTEPEHQDRLMEIEKTLKQKADDLEWKDGYLSLLSGTERIGERVRILVDKTEIELKNNGDAIVWRYTDSNEWITLIELSDIRGKDGTTPELERRGDHFFAIYKE